MHIQEHSKEYSTDLEELHRHVIWQSAKKYVEVHNTHADVFGFRLAMNKFADLEGAEFVQLYNGYIAPATRNDSLAQKWIPPVDYVPEASVDWRTKGVVTQVKNQGRCGSCWSFSATGSLEGQHALKTGRLVSLSEQNLMDCSRSYGNHGCQGGLMDAAFRYIAANHGIDTESSYPYEAHNGICRFKTRNIGATATGHRDISRGDENALRSAVSSVGPISVAIDASKRSFQMYHSGVYNEYSCSSTRLDHGVLVVGYGTYESQDYWLVKNSWGANWGMQGYIMMSRNRRNQCGIASQASYPTV